jgi:hypothetical protein
MMIRMMVVVAEVAEATSEVVAAVLQPVVLLVVEVLDIIIQHMPLRETSIMEDLLNGQMNLKGVDMVVPQRQEESLLMHQHNMNINYYHK